MESLQIPFALAQLRVSSSPAFPAVVLDDEAVIPLDALAPLAAQEGFALSEADTLDGLLRNWDHNLRGLCAAVAALDDPAKGKYFRSAVSSIEFFTKDSPLCAPRQIVTLDAEAVLPRLASCLVGPDAKILIPRGCDGIIATPKIGLVVGRPLHCATVPEAAAAIAGAVTLSDYSNPDAATPIGVKQAPTFLAAGPYFVPAPFLDAQSELEARLPVNGELATMFAARDVPPFAETLAQLSHTVQLFPGDLIGLGPDVAQTTLPRLGDGDILEAAVTGLGRQTTNTIKVS